VDPEFRVVVATSTLAWGLNMPARRVIITGVHRGLELVESYNIQQMAGRAGRVGLDPRGDVYILLPNSEEELHRRRLCKPENITSKLLDFVGTEDSPHYKVLAFHLVSEIHHGHVKTKDDIYQWYERSFAHFQANDLDDEIIDKTLDLLMKCGAVREEEGVYKATSLGIVSSMFYYSPFDVADFKRNFEAIFSHHWEGNDLLVAVALGNVDTLRQGIVSKAEREEMAAFAAKVTQMFGGNAPKEPSIKGAYAYFTLLRGTDPGVVAGLTRNLQFDFPRAAQVLKAIDSMACKWKRADWFRRLQLRIAYGVREELVELCQLPQVGKARAEKLFKAGYRTVSDVAKDTTRLRGILKLKQETIDEIVNFAKTQDLVSP
jgi:helicase